MPEAPAYLLDAQQKVGSGLKDTGMDIVFDNINKLLWKEQFDKISEDLGHINVDAIDSDLLLSILTVTLPARSRIRNRRSFLSRVRRVFAERGQMEPGLFDGL